MTETLISTARQKGMTISFDPNLRLRMATIETFREILNPLLKNVDIFLPSDKELLLLMDTQNLEEALNRAEDLGVNHIVIKMGDRGGLLYKGGIRHQEPAFSFNRVVGSIPAGDAFNAGYLAAVLKAFEDTKALKLANCLGAMATPWLGGLTKPYPIGTRLWHTSKERASWSVNEYGILSTINIVSNVRIIKHSVGFSPDKLTGPFCAA